jgi:hypothetical protein
MTNTNLNLYLVTAGDVTPADIDTEWDGSDSVLVAAKSEDDALEAAEAYDRGFAQPDNMAWRGKTIVAVVAGTR